ncbi:MAG TPA: hypothetical protein VEW93_07910 [Acidimicrobiales bacterium]|nr:hypothetical protein [Acidimicrobiales bacterium]
MSVRARRGLFVAVLLACMPLSGWAGTHDAWRAVLGDDVGSSLAVFWDLQVESFVNVLLVVLVLDQVHGLHRGDDGRWAVAPRGAAARAAVYAGLLALALVCSAEGPLRSVLGVPLPDDVAASMAHYFRRALEGALAALGVLLFLDLVRPGPLAAAELRP